MLEDLQAPLGLLRGVNGAQQEVEDQRLGEPHEELLAGRVQQHVLQPTEAHGCAQRGRLELHLGRNTRLTVAVGKLRGVEHPLTLRGF